jgi:tetratricopeptide (TPR) repeat protein
VAAVAIVPAMLLIFEGALRLAGYGFPTSFFKRIQIGDQDYLVENDKFGWRFFPPELSRSPPPVAMTATKPPTTYRIFLFGESAAMGDPAPAFGAGRYLEMLLNDRFPEHRFEVICVAMTAINSHAILPIARECARRGGDLWIVYMGNNEMAGPFGAATVFGKKAPSLSYVRLSLAIQKSRLGQMLLALGRRMKSDSSPSGSWAGMKMFLNHEVLPTDPAREAVENNFRGNLHDILETGLGAGAKIILNTVAVNLKDCAPFASAISTNLSNEQRGALAALLYQGTQEQMQGNVLDAAAHLELATSIDGGFADLHFRFGQSLQSLTNFPGAADQFKQARDLDALPFRVTSKLNDITLQTGQQLAGPNLALLDAAGFLASNSPTHVSGQEVFYEHVHCNFDGNYILGRAWAEQAERFLPPGWAGHPTNGWASQASCEQMLGLTDWHRYDVLQDVLNRVREAPFTNQFNAGAREMELFRQLNEVRQKLQPAAYAQARTICEAALGKRPQDHWLHQNLAELLEHGGDLQHAVAEWEQVLDLLPHYHLAYYQIGRLLSAQGRFAEAEPPLLRALELRPDLSAGWLELGNIHAAENKAQLAMEDFERARRLVPENYRVYLSMGKVLSKMNRRDEAITNFVKAVQLGPPNYWEAHNALGEELAFHGQTAAAQKQFEEVLRINPNVPMAHLNLGVALAIEGCLDEAIFEFEETIRLDPRNKLAPDYLAKVRAKKHRSESP